MDLHVHMHMHKHMHNHVNILYAYTYGALAAGRSWRLRLSQRQLESRRVVAGLNYCSDTGGKFCQRDPYHNLNHNFGTRVLSIQKTVGI